MASSQDYVQIGPIPWEQARSKLDFALKRIFRRLNQAEGRQGAPTIYADLSMNGNHILGGPSPQTAPTAAEFITKDYADATYGAAAVKPQLEATGAFPLVITNLSGNFAASNVILSRVPKFDTLQSITSSSLADVRTDGGESARFIADGSFYVGLTSSDRGGGPYFISAFPHIVATGSTNAEYIETGCIVGQFGYISTAATGSGTARPLVFGTNAMEKARITTAGQLMVGGQSSDIASLGSATILTLADANGFICATSANNASYGALGVNSGATVVLQTAHSGTGTTLPLSFQTDANERGRITVAHGVLLWGMTSSDRGGTDPYIISIAPLVSATATVNAEYIEMGCIPGSFGYIATAKTGSGTVRPLVFGTNGAENLRLTTDPFLQFTTSYAGGNLSAAGTVALRNNAGALQLSQNGGAWSSIGGVSGSGTSPHLAYWSGGTSLGDTQISYVSASLEFLVNNAGILFGSTDSISADQGNSMSFVVNSAERMNLDTTSSATNTAMKLNLNGSVRRVAIHNDGTRDLLYLV